MNYLLTIFKFFNGNSIWYQNVEDGISGIMIKNISLIRDPKSNYQLLNECFFDFDF